MAKKEKVDKVVVVENVANECDKGADTEQPKVKETKLEEVVVEEIVPKAMKVEVIPTKDLHCDIGGTRYQFFKNQKQKVPSDVERVLRERDLIK